MNFSDKFDNVALAQPYTRHVGMSEATTNMFGALSDDGVNTELPTMEKSVFFFCNNTIYERIPSETSNEVTYLATGIKVKYRAKANTELVKKYDKLTNKFDELMEKQKALENEFLEHK